MSRVLQVLVLTACLLVAAVPLIAQEGQEGQKDPVSRIEVLERRVAELSRLLESRDNADLAQLRIEIDAITRELERLRLGQEVVSTAVESRFGLGPAATNVYGVQEGVSIGGYGELLYQNFASTREDDSPSGKTDRLDFLRSIVYVGYKFDDRFVFNSEIEFEHASSEQAGSVSVEFAYLDFLLSNQFNLRAGLVLLPMGFINELHEPPTFLSSARPEVERQIIPSTWRENGFGFFGDAGPFSYRAYLVAGFDGVGGATSDADGFSATGLRGGRQNGSKSSAESFAVSGRLDYRGIPGLLAGSSFYVGDSGQDNEDPFRAGETLGASTFIWEGHAQYQAHGLWLRGLATIATVDDVAELNQLRGLTGNQSIGERMTGWYLEGGYNVLRDAETAVELYPFIRYEQLNTQDEVPAGFLASGATDRETWTIGAALKPIPNVILKADYLVRSNQANSGIDEFNLSLGYLF